jgi:hypothetical protein
MVRTLVEMALGPLGIQILDAYLAHSLVINSLVLAYGFVVFASWRNLVGIRRRLVGSMISQLRASGGPDEDLKLSHVLSRTTIPWETAMESVRFPWVARQMELWPKRASLSEVQSLLDRNVLAADVIEELTGKRPKDEKKLEAKAAARAKRKSKPGRRTKR